uniref:SCP domain-containing protein n=1 Tax=Mesocestoides corti TaxID=53468 RepID=A0A5K3FNJ6_MESCO
MIKFICLVTLVRWSEAGQLSAEERAKVLEVHRKIREEVEPPASNMMLMDYSVELEKLAEKWLLNCTYPLPSASVHPEYEDVEVALQSGYNIENASFEPASRFNSDKEAFKYETNTCTSLCGNYRRIIWATSRQVGCYRHKCEHSDIWTTPRYVMACLYKPGQRNPNVRPYISGSSCSGCPQGLGCYRKQCTDMTTLGAVWYANKPPEDAVATDSFEMTEPPIQTQTRTSTTRMPLVQTQKVISSTKKPLIQSQPATSTTKKASMEKPQVPIRAEVPLELVKKQSGDASMLQSEAAPFKADQSTSQTQTSTSVSRRLSAVSAALFAFIAMIFLA